MKIAMLGSGAAGSCFAAYLKRGGADDITLIDLNKEHLDKIAADGLRLAEPEGECLLTGFKTATSADDIGIMDLVIIMVKCTITEQVLASAMACIGPDTVVATLQNGLANEEHVKKLIPADRIIFGCGMFGTELIEPGYVRAKPISAAENMFFGACGERNALTERAGNYLEECFKKGGLKPKFYDDVRPPIWYKMVSNAGFNTVSALMRVKVGEAAADPNGNALALKVWREAADVAEAMGIHGVWEYEMNLYDNLVKGLGSYYPSMAQDMLFKHCQTEVTSLTGAISDYGKQYGVPTPTCDVLTQLVLAIEANYDKQVL